MRSAFDLIAWLALADACSDCQRDGPASQWDQPHWLQQLQDDRESTLASINWTGGVFNQVQWTQTAYIQPQMHIYDRFFYDPETHRYTVQRFLHDLKERYGGIDAVLIWPTYTNIGVDDRNQFDYFRSLPGGLDAVLNFTRELKSNGVHVLWPYNPWDTGSRREPLSDEDTFAKLLKQTEGDGFNGDTMGQVPKTFWDAGLKVDYPLAFEPEGGGKDEELNWATMGWGYWRYPYAPVVDRFKFLTRGKFMTNVCNRWAKSKTDDLQMAWFNGDGYESWENVWGVWNGITPRDGEAIRRVATMLRYFGGQGFLQSPEWEPHSREVWREGVFASKWPLATKWNATLWTIVNRGAQDLTGAQLVVSPGMQYFDCYHGESLRASDVAPSPPAPPPVPPAPEPQNYTRFWGSRVIEAHGCVAIDVAPLPNTSLSMCAARCDELVDCSCFSQEQGPQECSRYTNCEPAEFDRVGNASVHLKRQGYSKYALLKIKDSSGGIKIGSGVDGLSLEQCQDWCTRNTTACDCVVYKAGGSCTMFSSCVTEHFLASGQMSTYVNEARRPQPSAPGPAPHPLAGPQLSFELEAGGFGCILQADVRPDEEAFDEFMSTMKSLTTDPLSSFSSVWKYLGQTMVDIPRTELTEMAPAGTVYVPKANFKFVVNGVEIEGDDEHGVDVQYPWEEHPQKSHNHALDIGPLYVDRFPVSCANYSSYLEASGYRPRDTYNWLKNWNLSDAVESPVPPVALGDVPVTYVGLAEARAYCSWVRGRLPHSWEWQYIAQGSDGRPYPWGPEDDPARRPDFQDGSTFRGPDPVSAHAPAGDSPFGVSDLVGNVWQYTDEFVDEHTRAVILRGGSTYRPAGSKWYFPQAQALHTHEKYFLMDDRYERAGTVGFRCVFDAAPTFDKILV